MSQPDVTRRDKKYLFHVVFVLTTRDSDKQCCQLFFRESFVDLLLNDVVMSLRDDVITSPRCKIVSLHQISVKNIFIHVNLDLFVK